MPRQYNLDKKVNVIPREDTHKKSVFFSGRTTKDLTPPPNGLVVHATFFSLIIA